MGFLSGTWNIWFSNENIAIWLMLYYIERKEMPINKDVEIMYNCSRSKESGKIKLDQISLFCK